MLLITIHYYNTINWWQLTWTAAVREDVASLALRAVPPRDPGSAVALSCLLVTLITHAAVGWTLARGARAACLPRVTEPPIHAPVYADIDMLYTLCTRQNSHRVHLWGCISLPNSSCQTHSPPKTEDKIISWSSPDSLQPVHLYNKYIFEILI